MDWETLFRQNQEDLRAQNSDHKNMALVEEIKKSNAKVIKGLDTLNKTVEKRFTAKKSHWYQTGEITITSATSQGTYPKFENLLVTLKHPSTAGLIENTGVSGNIFVVFSKDSADISANEIKILPGAVFDWGEEQKITDIRYIHLRCDSDNSTYQIVAS